MNLLDIEVRGIPLPVLVISIAFCTVGIPNLLYAVWDKWPLWLFVPFAGLQLIAVAFMVVTCLIFYRTSPEEVVADFNRASVNTEAR